MNKTIFLLCLMVGVVSSGLLQSLISSTNNDPTTALCALVANNKAKASDFLTQVSQALSNNVGNTKFSTSLTYLLNQQNQQNLVAGGPSCLNFFNGLATAYKADRTNGGATVVNAKQELLQFLEDRLPQLKNLLG